MPDVTVNPYSNETDAAFLNELLVARKTQLREINVQSLSVSGAGFSRTYTKHQIAEIKEDYRQLTERIVQINAEADGEISTIRVTHSDHSCA